MLQSKLLERIRQRLFGMTPDELKEIEEIEQITLQVLEELQNKNHPVPVH